MFFILFFCCCSFCFWFYFVSFNVWLNNSFSHMKRLRLVDYFVCLSVLFLNPKFQGNNRQPRYFSPALKRLRILFIYFYFNLILHLALNFTLYFCHSFYYKFILTDFMADFILTAIALHLFLLLSFAPCITK